MNYADLFISRSKIIHNDIYDYSLVEYKNNRTKVVVICKEHGPFLISPDKHVAGGGCQLCSNKERGSYHKMDRDMFIQKSISIYGNIYDYSAVVMNGTKNKVEVICKKHGSFWVDASNHIYGKHNACKKCGIEKRVLKKTIGTDKFIQAAINIHGDKYDYSKVVYKKAKLPVIIVCRKHGDFTATPDNHLRGKTGCPMCLVSNGEDKVFSVLTELNISFEREKRFDDCRDKRVLPFDFYFERSGIRYLVEYDGVQHFVQWSPGKGGRKLREGQKLAGVQKRDAIKNKYAEENGIKLIRIPYTVNNVKKFITERLCNELSVS